MKIVHIFHHFNEFGGAEEHVATLAEMQSLNGHDVYVALVQSAQKNNPFFQRLREAKIPVCQWSVWISRLSGDWDTRETILISFARLLLPIIVPSALFISLIIRRPWDQIQKSIEGRIRNILKKLLNLQREQKIFLLMLARECYRIKPDILHLHSYGAGLEYVLDWTYKNHIPTVYQEHSTPDLTIRNNYGLPWNLNKANLVIAVSEISANGLINYCHVTNPIRVIPPIVLVDTVEDFVRKINDNSLGVQILTIARLSPEKGLTMLIEAAELVRFHNVAATFTIYGEGPMRDSFEEIIQMKQLTNTVILAGSFPHQKLADIMAKSDIFVLPSITEGLPLSVIEAMAFGMPIITTNVGGIPSLIKDGINGLLCKAEDACDLAEKIMALIDNLEFRLTLGLAARLSYQRGPFRPEVITNMYDSAYQEAINQDVSVQTS